MFLAYAVTALAWYLPLHYESRWLRRGGVAATFLVWLLIVAWIVVKRANSKLFPY
jgi:hypothetical protein